MAGIWYFSAGTVVAFTMPNVMNRKPQLKRIALQKEMYKYA